MGPTQKIGGDRFYRVEYPKNKDGKEISYEDRRKKEKEYIEESENKKKLISTGIADNDYVKYVIKAYVDGDKTAEKQLYHEPTKSDKEMHRIQKLFGSDAKNEINKQLLKDMEVKRDNTRVAPTMPPK